jgi:hypothetical protein
MAGIIDRIGTFTGKVLESTINQTAKGFPQWAAKFTALKKYANTKEELEYYKLAEPAYVDWDGSTITAYLVLFNDNGPLKNYEQLQAAFAWDGDAFADVLSFVGKDLLFRVEEDTYNNKVSLKVNWVDVVDASPERTLKSLDATGIAALTAKFLTGMKKPVKPALPAKAVSAPVAAPKPAPMAASAPVTAPIASAVDTTSPPAAAPAEAPKTGKGKKTPPPPAAESAPAGLPTETTKDAAWEYVITNRGANDEAIIAETWLAACSEVGENRPEDKFTGADWAKVQGIVQKDLQIK